MRSTSLFFATLLAAGGLASPGVAQQGGAAPPAAARPQPAAPAPTPAAPLPAQAVKPAEPVKAPDRKAAEKKAAEAKSAEKKSPVSGGRRGESLADCMKFWDRGTHMTKVQWRATCIRQLANERRAQESVATAGAAERRTNRARRNAEPR